MCVVPIVHGHLDENDFAVNVLILCAACLDVRIRTSTRVNAVRHLLSTKYSKFSKVQPEHAYLCHIEVLSIQYLNGVLLDRCWRRVTVFVCFTFKNAPRLAVHTRSRKIQAVLYGYVCSLAPDSLCFWARCSSFLHAVLSRLFPEILLSPGGVALPPAGRAHPEESAAGGGETAAGPRGQHHHGHPCGPGGLLRAHMQPPAGAGGRRWGL